MRTPNAPPSPCCDFRGTRRRGPKGAGAGTPSVSPSTRVGRRQPSEVLQGLNDHRDSEVWEQRQRSSLREAGKRGALAPPGPGRVRTAWAFAPPRAVCRRGPSGSRSAAGQGHRRDRPPRSARPRYRKQRAGLGGGVTARLGELWRRRRLGPSRGASPLLRGGTGDTGTRRRGRGRGHSDGDGDTATGTGTRRTFGDALPPAPRVAGDAAAAEAGGEVPAGRVHGALVSAVGARRARVRVVAENCSEKAERAPREWAPRERDGAHTRWGSPGAGPAACSYRSGVAAPLLKPPRQTGLRGVWEITEASYHETA